MLIHPAKGPVLKLTRTMCTLLGALVIALGAATAAEARAAATPQKWVSVFCGSIVTWEKAVKARSSTFEQAMRSLNGHHTNLPRVRDQLVGYLNGIVDLSKTMVSNVHHVGAPEIKSGDQLQTAVEAALTMVVTSFQADVGKASHLPVDTAAHFRTAGVALGHEIKASSGQLGGAFSALSKLSTPALDSAAKHDATCKQLNG